MSGAWHTGSSADGHKIASLKRVDLHRAIAEATAQAFRNGVEAVGADGLAALDAQGRRVVVDRSEARRITLRERLEEERRIARRLRDQVVREVDPEVARAYETDARDHTLEVKRLEEELARVGSHEVTPRLPDSFTGEVDFLLAGIESLLDPTGMVDREDAENLEAVLKDLRIEVVDEDWCEFSLYWQIPANGSVVNFGPISGRVPRQGRVMTPAERQVVENGGPSRVERRKMVHRLEQAGYPHSVARAVSIAPFPQLSEALLGGEPRWSDNPDSFDHGAFNAHLREVYVGLRSWDAGTWCHTNPKRQILADVVAAFGNSARLDRLQHVTLFFGIKNTDLHPLTLPRLKEGTPVWEPSIRRVGQWSAATTAEGSYVESHVCPQCAQAATAVARVPEVPGSILCRQCVLSPFAVGLRFPQQYLELALPETSIPEELLEEALSMEIGSRRKGPRPSISK